MQENTKLSKLVVEQINAVTQNENERKFLESILEKELFYYSNEDIDELKREYRSLLETYFPFQTNSQNKEEQ